MRQFKLANIDKAARTGFYYQFLHLKLSGISPSRYEWYFSLSDFVIFEENHLICHEQRPDYKL